MNARCLYIIMSIVSLLFLTNCRDEEDVRPSEGKRTITVDLGIAMSRVVEGTDLGEGTPSDMKVWIFEHGTENLLAYLPDSDPVFSGSDALGGLVNTKEYVVEVENSIQALDFYVVLNSGNGTELDLSEISTPTQIKEATFTGITSGLEDNQVPAYGFLENFDVSEHKNSYDVPTIELTRAVGKLELFFTKESENFTLGIKKVTLTKIPDKGYLVEPVTYDLSYSDEEETLFSSTNSTGSDISAVLTNNDAILGNFSKYQDDETKLQSLFSAYLLENPNGGKWAGTEDDGNLDYTYPENITPVSDDRYKMTVFYQVSGSDKTQEVYLPAIKRNEWNKIFVRVKDNGRLEIKYKAMPWQKVTSEIGYAPQHISTDKNPFKNLAGNWEDTDIANGNNYVLFPIETYNTSNRNTTQELFSYLYDTPEGGDNEARLCILTRPTYNHEQHYDLKAGSAGARYLFLLTGPAGATWEAHLTNYTDFSFSTSDDDDFKNSEEYGDNGGLVNKVTHGIARKKPYVIQIIANHLYTGYEKGMSGYTTEDGFNEKGFDGVEDDEESSTEWIPYFGDDYLTEWGYEREKEGEEEGKIVETEFYITVKLTDGSEYELEINPEYTADIKSERFPFNNKHRYAGTKTRIWIRQIRAQYNWPNLEYLARDLDESIEDDDGSIKPWNTAYWWTQNQYWNPNHIKYLEDNVWDNED